MKILSFGEILFDRFDDAEKLGGAPLNFCADAVKLGAEGYMLSALSDDRPGSNARHYMDNAGIDYSLSNTQSLFGTGSCVVTRGEDGEPSYDLAEGVAYDHITLSDEELARIQNAGFDLFYFGTLAQRGSASRATLERVLSSCAFSEVFFDVNIRQTYYSNDVIRAGLTFATIVKLNYDECRLLCDMGFCTAKAGEKTDDGYLRTFCRELCETYAVRTVVVTLDKDGACAWRDGEYRRCASGGVDVVSAVGAGDAFSACFAMNILDGKPLAVCLERANLLGGYTVGYLEAIPPYTDELLSRIRG